METILEIRVDTQTMRMVAWDPYAEDVVAEVAIRPAVVGDGYADGEDPQAIATALTALTVMLVNNRNWLEGGA